MLALKALYFLEGRYVIPFGLSAYGREKDSQENNWIC